MRYSSRSGRSTRGNGGGPPAWLVFLLGVALIFGLYYLWQGAQNFLRTGGLGVSEVTQRAAVVSTATAARVFSAPGVDDRTRPPTLTPVPPCQDFVVSVPNAIVREGPASASGIVTSYNEGEPVCVISRDPESDWYAIDLTPGTRRLDLAYMHESVIRALNPTPRPTITPTPLPTVTAMPSLTPTITRTPRPTATVDLDATETPTPTAPPTATEIRQSA